MAGSVFVANTTSETALASSSEKTLIRIIAPSSHAIKIKEWGVFFDGISVTAEPVLVKMVVDTTAEGGTAASFTTSVPTKRSGATTLSQCVIHTMGTSSAINGAASYAVREVHPQSGYQEKFSFGDEIVITGTVALHVVSPATVNVMAEIVFEE